jgi:hypothetical protein
MSSMFRNARSAALATAWVASIFGALLVAGACEEEPALVTTPLRPEANPSEYTGLTVRLPVEDDEAVDALSRLFGSQAASGSFATIEFPGGVVLSSTADPRTPEQVILTLEMTPSTTFNAPSRVLTRVPASLAYGAIVTDTVDAALAVAAEELAEEGDMDPFRLEYRVRSALGGNLTIALDYSAAGTMLEVEARTPRTSLVDDQINEPALEGEPYETIYGLVNFTMTRDHFDFFSTRAYGLSAGRNQNFKDFWLLPHSWLRLTVTPELDQLRVNVGFEVVTRDGRRIPLAAAPASLLAGDQFRENVYAMIDGMLAAEAAEEGSSVPFTVPFYYDDPDGGGVVEVLASGESGTFSVAYAVESPTSFLQDVEFVAYQGVVNVPADWDAVDPSCAELGTEPAAQGHFEMTFQASSTVRESASLDGELRGPVWGSIYRDTDVTIAGPNEGAEAAASFHFDEIDVREGGSAAFRIDTQLPAGEYQVLGFMDIDANADPDDADPDVNDPVMIPIGGYTLECAEQPITVEFAILLPEGEGR